MWGGMTGPSAPPGFSRSKELQYVRALASKALGPARGYGWRPQPSPDLYRNFINH